MPLSRVVDVRAVGALPLCEDGASAPATTPG